MLQTNKQSFCFKNCHPRFHNSQNKQRVSADVIDGLKSRKNKLKNFSTIALFLFVLFSAVFGVESHAASVQSLPCPSQLSFGTPTSPVITPNANCLYNSVNCVDKTKRHTGINYYGTGNAVAIAYGTVVKVEAASANDHGMGNNVIVRHVTPAPGTNCNIIYSTYSHLASINVVANQAVTKGQIIGAIGGSGFGNPNRWTKGLHFEMKTAPVSGNPFGVGAHSSSCAVSSLNAKPGSCWEYVGKSTIQSPKADDYGYLNPALYINKIINQPTYRQVKANDTNTCALKSDNTIACWGYGGLAGSTGSPLPGKYKSIESGCSLKTDNTVACMSLITPPAGKFKTISVYSDGGNLSAKGCGIKIDNTLGCWGFLNTPPFGTFSTVSVGLNFNCAIKIDQTVICWGSGTFTPPSAKFTAVSVGSDYACGIKVDGTLACWGRASFTTLPPIGNYKSISSGNSHACAVRSDSMVICWGFQTPAGIPTAKQFAAVSTGRSHDCALTTSGFLVCWGRNDSGQASPPTGNYKAVSVDFDYDCSIKTNGILSCLGTVPTGMPTTGSFKAVSTGDNHACAIKSDDTLFCWGNNQFLQATPPPGKFLAVSAGKYFNCALSAINTLVCWGNNVYGQATPPLGKFKAVSASNGQLSGDKSHACAIKSNDTLACWGDNTYGQATPQAGTFKSVSAAPFNTCAVKTDGALICWGLNRLITPPAGTFKTVSAASLGGYCALKSDNSLFCGGNIFSGVPPRGSFKTVQAGQSTSCGLRTTGFVTCWGLFRVR